MQTDVLSRNDLLSFTAIEQMAYGKHITLGEEILENDGKWTTLALVYPSGKETKINLGSKEFEGQSFIVLRSWPDEDGNYSHQAIPVGRLEETLREIESSIVELLRPANDSQHES